MLKYTGCAVSGASYEWKNQDGVTISPGLTAYVSNLQNGDKWGYYTLTETLPGNIVRYSQLQLIEPLAIKAERGLQVGNGTTFAEGAFICQDDQINLFIPDGWASNIQWTQLEPSSAAGQTVIGSVSPGGYIYSFRATLPTASSSQTSQRYEFTVSVNSPCGLLLPETATFYFYSKKRDAGCGQAPRPSSELPQSAMPKAAAYPVPGAKSLSIPAATVGAIVALYNGQGTEVRRTVGDGSAVEFSIADLPDGLYIVRSLLPDGRKTDQRVLITH